MGIPRASVTTERLVPSLPRSVGLGPVFFPTQRSLGHRSVGRQPLPVDPDQPVIAQQSLPPELVEPPGLDPFGEAPVGRRLRADPGGAQGAHWLPVRRTKKIPSIAARSGTRGLWQPSGWRGRGGSSTTIRSHKASGIRQPLSWIIWPIARL